MTPTFGTDLDDLMVSPQASILDVMKTIDRTGLEVALVCDERRKLLSVVTDGDIRRSLIKGMPLSAPIKNVGNEKFTSVRNETTRMDALELMLKDSFKCLPVIDNDGRLVDLHTLSTTLRGE